MAKVDPGFHTTGSHESIGCEIGPIDGIVARFAALAEVRTYPQRIRSDLNCLFTARTLALRQQNGLWTVESVRGSQKEEPSDLFLFATGRGY